MTKERSVQFMFWFTILFIIGGVGACQLAKPLHAYDERRLAADMAEALAQEEADAKLAAELFVECNARARKAVQQ